MNQTPDHQQQKLLQNNRRFYFALLRILHFLVSHLKYFSAQWIPDQSLLLHQLFLQIFRHYLCRFGYKPDNFLHLHLLEPLLTSLIPLSFGYTVFHHYIFIIRIGSFHGFYQSMVFSIICTLVFICL